MITQKPSVGVIGAGACSPEIFDSAYEVGRLIALNKWVLICGGLGGVMEGAAKGCHDAGGIAVGILPGKEKSAANPFICLSIPTGLGEARNLVLIEASDVIVAIAQGFGTLSEIGFALKMGKPLVGLKTWSDIGGIDYAKTPEEVIAKVSKYLSVHH